MRINNTSPIIIVKRVIYALFLRELKTRFGDYKLGIFWVFLDPLIQIMFFVMLFGYIFKRVMPNVDYTVYVATGILTWLMFKNVLTRGMVAIESNKGLFVFRQLKPLDAFFSRAFLEFFIYSVVYIVSILGLIHLERKFTFLKPLELIICYLCTFLIASGLSLIAMSISILYRDVRKIINIILRLLYFVSGIIFPIKIIPVEYRYLLTWNPILHIMELTRESLFPAFSGSVGNLSYIYISTIMVLFLGLGSFYLAKNKIL
jgi:capsular polysaccharide transport system permease protein